MTQARLSMRRKKLLERHAGRLSDQETEESNQSCVLMILLKREINVTVNAQKAIMETCLMDVSRNVQMISQKKEISVRNLQLFQSIMVMVPLAKKVPIKRACSATGTALRI